MATHTNGRTLPADLIGPGEMHAVKKRSHLGPFGVFRQFWKAGDTDTGRPADPQQYSKQF